MAFAELYDSFVCRQTWVIFGGPGVSFIPPTFSPQPAIFYQRTFLLDALN